MEKDIDKQADLWYSFGTMIITCKCGKEFSAYPSRVKNGRAKYCSKNCKNKYHTRRSGLKYNIKKENPTWFVSGFIPWNKGKKGVMPTPWNKGTRGLLKANSGSFKKGNITWNKGKDWKEMQWEKHPNFNGGKYSYVRHLRRLGKKPICERCKKIGEFSNKIVVHHKNEDRTDNKIENLEVLCSVCHSNIHKNWEKKCQKL